MLPVFVFPLNKDYHNKTEIKLYLTHYCMRHGTWRGK